MSRIQYDRLKLSVSSGHAFKEASLLLQSSGTDFHLEDLQMMPILRLQLLTQFCIGSHASPLEQGRLAYFARPAIPWHVHR